MAILGLDIGTTALKCQVYSENGNLICGISREYDVVREGDTHYINGKELYDNTILAIEECGERAGEEIKALAVSSMGEVFFPISKEGEILSNPILYSDTRGEPYSNLLEQEMGERLSSICGGKASYIFSLPKIMWMKEHMKEVYDNSEKFLLVGDFIAYKMTGETKIDFSLASRTMAFDISKKVFSREILVKAGASAEKFSTPVPTGEIIGKVKKGFFKSPHLQNTLVVAGGHDQVMAGVGAGVLEKGQAIIGTGTVECMMPLFEKTQKLEELSKHGYALVPYPTGDYVTYAFNFAGGALLKWFRDKLAKQVFQELKKTGENFYSSFEKQMPETPTDLLILPYFLGANTPNNDSKAKGVIVGLDTQTGLGEIFKALMEGATFEMKLNLDILKGAGIEVNEIFATGGGANSKAWLQIKADILGVPITKLETSEAGILGCVVLCAKALGLCATLKEASAKFSRKGETFMPREEFHKIYLEKFEKYKKMYPSFKAVMG